MNDEEGPFAIEVEDISLDFPVMKSAPLFFKELLLGKWKDLGKRKYFRAIDHLSFKIKKGEVLGIIGPNGAGKSTLLRVLAGIYVPEKGRVKTRGRVSLLAGLGAGFQSKLTGIDNIFLSGSIYGIPNNELKKLVPSIIEYSGIESFIDRPLRTYSSGMRARLAFSIVSHMEPDIMLIDEVIAVGDSSFKKKSMSRIKELASGESTVVIVSHSQSLLSIICDRILCLHNGHLDCLTEDKDYAIERYHELSITNKN